MSPTPGQQPRIWRKSSHSGNENACLEMLTPPPPDQAPIRDSKTPQAPGLVYSASAWNHFLRTIRD